ncbi:uncharacterized protein [Elaeis guineensis]|uniref:Uncharacterized protein LOC109505211 isoform X1 n=1 Tax=Elaeis guineensis var. tenera TaxID=51953 RepID=A0A6J0PDN5_ELAGV|nr:uncharacterized protein LOC109505211 isoform X1 [Elaeis guineensis]
MSRVLLRNDDERKLKFSSVMFGRTLFSVLGVLALATVVGTIIIDGFPFQKELLTPWMAATLIDFYINVIAISHCHMCVHRPSAFPALLSRLNVPYLIGFSQQAWKYILQVIYELLCFIVPST